MDYSKKKYLLSVVSEKMSYFLYEIPKKQEDGPPLYTEVIGDIFYIADPECYFVNGKFDAAKNDILTIENIPTANISKMTETLIK